MVRIRTRLACLLLVSFLGDASAYQCTFCLPGKYKSEIANYACLACPSHTYRIETGADGVEDCLDCPANSVAVSGSSAKEACLCKPGFFGPLGGPCTPCAAGRYSDNIGQSACSFCPAYTNSPVQSDALTDCTCVAGYTGADGVACTACELNKYKTTTGSAACTNCVTNTMTLGLGNTNINACICTPGYTAGVSAVNMQTYSSTACARFLTLTSKPSFATVSTRNNVGVGSAMLPTYNPTGGPNGKGHLEFKYRTYMDWNTFETVSTDLEYFDAVPQYFNIATNGGFTLVAVVRSIEPYTSDQQGQTIFEAVSARNSFSLRRTNSGSGIGMYLQDLQWGEQLNIENHNVDWTQWVYIAIYFETNQRKISMSINSVISTNQLSSENYAQFTDNSFATVKVGSSKDFVAQATFNGDMAGVFFVDEVLSISAITGITNQIKEGVDLTIMCDGNAGGCTGCSAGKYKVSSGPAACTDCGANTYSEAVAASAAATCTTCPGDTGTSVSLAGNGALNGCKCNLGYTGPDGAVCSACVAGSYKTATGSALCATCDTGKFSTDVARTDVATCQTCPSNSNTVGGGHDAPGDCTCNAGYTGADGVWCDACVRGKFKSITGSSACLSCAANKYSTVLGSVGGTCEDCPTNTNAPEASSSPAACTCNAGSTGGGGTTACTLCVAGTFKVATGPAACSICPADWYSTLVGATSDMCEQCPENSMAPPGSDEKNDCVCKPGFTGSNGGPCVACPPGKFKTVQGSAACSDCPSHTYSTLTAKTDSTCSSCPTNAVTLQTGSNVATQCVCNLGYTGPNGGACTACVAGKFKDATGSADCTLCGANKYQPMSTQTSITSCLSCPFANLESPEGSPALTDCQCSPGYFSLSGENGQACTQCFSGRFKPLKGPQVCTLCQNGTFSPALGASSSATCQTCHDNTESWMGSGSRAQCHCVAGFYTENMGQESATCVSCGVGTYNSVLNANACSKCGPGTYSNQLTATSRETCLICSDGYSAEGQSQCDRCPDNAFAGPGKGLLTDCQCNPGFFGSNGATCQQCVAGKFKPLHGPMDCTDCTIDKYSVQLGQVADTTCLSCAANTVAPAGSNSEDDCKCKLGHTSSVPGVDGKACVACAMGKFKAALGQAPCENCGIDKYLDTTGATAAGACKDCFLFSKSPAGSDSEEDCECVGGRERT